MKYIYMLLALSMVAAIWLYNHPEKLIDAAVSSADMSSEELLSDTADHFISLCKESTVQRRIKLSREECEQRILNRESICAEKVAEKWPGSVSNMDQVNEIGAFYGQCLVSDEA